MGCMDGLNLLPKVDYPLTALAFMMESVERRIWMV